MPIIRLPSIWVRSCKPPGPLLFIRNSYWVVTNELKRNRLYYLQRVQTYIISQNKKNIEGVKNYCFLNRLNFFDFFISTCYPVTVSTVSFFPFFIVTDHCIFWRLVYYWRLTIIIGAIYWCQLLIIGASFVMSYSSF